MKVSQQHFIEQQFAFTQTVLESAAAFCNTVYYGLLPPVYSNTPSCTLHVNIENGSVLHVQLSHCRAVTPGGAFIEIDPQHSLPVTLSARMDELVRTAGEADNYLLVLSVDPYALVPAGEADPEEVPARYPYTRPAYALSLLPLAQDGPSSIGPFHVSVGKLHIRDGVVQLAGGYIPPCTAVYSYPVLADAHSMALNLLLKLEGLCQQITHKILQKDQQYQLAQIIKHITEHILLYLNNHLYHFNHLLPHEPPARMIAAVAGLAKTIKNAIDIRQGTGKEELLNYFSEWCDLNQAQFEQVVAAVMGHAYQHTDIEPGIEKSIHFLKEITGLYMRLSELDYIGRKMEKGIFVKEEQIKEENPNKPRISFWTR